MWGLAWLMPSRGLTCESGLVARFESLDAMILEWPRSPMSATSWRNIFAGAFREVSYV